MCLLQNTVKMNKPVYHHNITGKHPSLLQISPKTAQVMGDKTLASGIFSSVFPIRRGAGGVYQTAAAIKMLLRKTETERQREGERERQMQPSVRDCDRQIVMALHLAKCVHAIDALVIFIIHHIFLLFKVILMPLLAGKSRSLWLLLHRLWL